MYNWSIDEKKLAKEPEKYAVWKLEQTVNFGLGKEKLDSRELLKHWDALKIDPARKKFLSLLLNEK
jgi:hypothetical protein